MATYHLTDTESAMELGFYFCILSRSMDVSEALEVPGVVAVVTANDIPGKNGDGEEKVFAENEVYFVLVVWLQKIKR